MSLISVIVPVFNGELYVAEALASIQRQTGVELEIIVVDDGSTDGSHEIVATIAAADDRIRLLSGPNTGAAAARNRGLTVARGEFIAFLDADDVFPAGRLARNMSMFLADEKLDGIASDILFFTTLGPDNTPAAGTPTLRLQAPNLPAHIFRRRVFDQVGHLDEAFTQAEDGDLLFRMLEAGVKLINDNEIGVYYRRHEDNMTNDIPTAQSYMLKMLHASINRRRETGAKSSIPRIRRLNESGEAAGGQT